MQCESCGSGWSIRPLASALAMLALLLCSSYSLAQCPSGSCSAPGYSGFRFLRSAQIATPVISSQDCSSGTCSARTSSAATYSWLPDPDGSGRVYLFSGSTHVGTLAGGAYRRIVHGAEWPIETPPIAPPFEAQRMSAKIEQPKLPVIIGKSQQVFEAAAPDEPDGSPPPEKGPPPRQLPDELPEWQTQGVDIGKMREEQEPFSLNGLPISKKSAFQAMAGTLTDDRGKRFVTAVGDQAFVDDFKKLWKSMPDSVKEKVHVQAYPRSRYEVALNGFADGVSIQDPPDKEGKGKVLSRFRSLPTAEQLTEAVRKADPNYKPDADPDPLKPAVPSVEPTQITLSLKSIMIGAGIAAVAIYAARKK